ADLLPASAGGSGTVYYRSYGTYVVVAYVNLRYWGSASISGIFEVVLYQNGTIDFNYDAITTIYGTPTFGLNYGVNQSYYNRITGIGAGTNDVTVRFTPGVITKPFQLLTPANDSTIYTGANNFTWTSLNPSFGTITYQWQLSNTASFSSIIQEETGIPENPTTTLLTKNIVVPSNGIYYWRVRPVFNGLYGNWTGPFTMNVIINDAPPALTSAGIVPAAGNQLTTFTFSAVYTDADNNQPVSITLELNGFLVPLVKQNPGDTNYADGCTYVFSSTLQPGIYSCSFNCTDGKYVNSTYVMVLNVTEVNNWIPWVEEVGFTPDSGLDTTTFTFIARYFDPDNNTVRAVNLVLNGTSIPMIETNASDMNVMDGKYYSYSSTLTWGLYEYRIECFDGLFTNSTALLAGPEVNPFLGFWNQTVFSDDFESGTSKWTTITGFWHLTTTASTWPNPCHSPISSMWYGQEGTGNYATGARTQGELTSISIDLSLLSTASLEFFYWLQGEGGSWDYGYVYVWNGATWVLLWQSNANVAPWQKVVLDISPYCGNPSFRLRFYFDSLDGINNNFRGFLVDDVKVYGSSTTNPVPSLLSPANNTSCFTGTVDYSWTTVDNPYTALNYTWQVSSTPTFTSIISQVDDIIEMPITTTSALSTIVPSNGIYYWRVRPTHGNFYSNWSSSFAINITINENAPVLSGESVNPATGNQFTVFQFSVMYADADNNPPLSMNVIINGTPHAMTKQNLGDTNYVDGCLYVYQTELDVGTYGYSFSCFDGKYNVASPVYTNCTRIETNYDAPVLAMPGVSPTVAFPTSTVTYSVIYTDSDDNAPASMTVVIDGVPLAMVKQNVSDDDYVDGCMYVYQTLMGLGNHHYFFECSDGAFSTNTSIMYGPHVMETINVAVLNEASAPSYFVGVAVNDYSSAATYLSSMGYNVSVITTADIIAGVLGNYDVLVLVGNGPSDASESAVEAAWLAGLGIIAFGGSICMLCDFGLLPAVSQDSNGNGVYWEFASGATTRVSTFHPITRDYSIGQSISGSASDPNWRSITMNVVAEAPYMTTLAYRDGNPSRWNVLLYEPVGGQGSIVTMWEHNHVNNVALRNMINRAV
nr:hypothetical protein [Candidatus Sigynarchaeota archaeon]